MFSNFAIWYAHFGLVRFIDGIENVNSKKKLEFEQIFVGVSVLNVFEYGSNYQLL